MLTRDKNWGSLDTHWELQFSNPEKVQNLRKTTPCYQKLATRGCIFTKLAGFVNRPTTVLNFSALWVQIIFCWNSVRHELPQPSSSQPVCPVHYPSTRRVCVQYWTCYCGGTVYRWQWQCYTEDSWRSVCHACSYWVDAQLDERRAYLPAATDIVCLNYNVSTTWKHGTLTDIASLRELSATGTTACIASLTYLSFVNSINN